MPASNVILGLPEALAEVRARAWLRAGCAAHGGAGGAAGGARARVGTRRCGGDPRSTSIRPIHAGWGLPQVRAADAAHGEALRVVGSVRAGEVWSGEALSDGEAIELMTGAPLPAGADAVAMVEHVEQRGDLITAGRALRAGENVVARGSEALAGSVVIAAGTLLSAAEIALAASCGCGEIAVYARPRVAIVATGDELVELDEVPQAQQIRNSNGYALSALVNAAGGEAVRLPITRDERGAAERSIREAASYDFVLLSGGVSMGKYDLVEEVLTKLGAEFFFTGVKMQPGRPVVFGKLAEGPYFFGLPGNPVSTQVTFTCLAAPLLRALGGAAEIGPRFVQAALAEDVAGNPALHRLLPAVLTSSLEGATVKLAGWRSSGDMAANARANCYAVFPPEREWFAAGDVVQVLLG